MPAIQRMNQRPVYPQPVSTKAGIIRGAKTFALVVIGTSLIVKLRPQVSTLCRELRANACVTPQRVGKIFTFISADGLPVKVQAAVISSCASENGDEYTSSAFQAILNGIKVLSPNGIIETSSFLPPCSPIGFANEHKYDLLHENYGPQSRVGIKSEELTPQIKKTLLDSINANESFQKAADNCALAFKKAQKENGELSLIIFMGFALVLMPFLLNPIDPSRAR